MSSLLEDYPSYDLNALPSLPSTTNALHHSRHSFIHKFGLVNLTAEVGSVSLSGRGEEDLVIRPILASLGGYGESNPLYVSDCGTIEI